MKGLILIALFGCALGATVLDMTSEWSQFKSKHGKLYTSHVEENMRRELFLKNYREIVAHNEKYEQGLVSFSRAVNKFADMTAEEIKVRNGYKKSQLRDYDDITRYVAPENFTAPAELDWRDAGAVSDVKDQGSCGSCWTFSTTGALEGAYFRKNGKIVSISEQNLVDCSTEQYGNYGCNGGDMPGALQYVIDNDGIDSEKTYPYEGRDRSCRYVASGNVTTARDILIVDPGNEELLKTALADVGPIAIAIDASNFDFQTYSGGVYYRDDCLTAADELDHAVLLVGYGTEKGVDYWLVKNSWNTDWGLDGYVKMTRNVKNNCGIASEPIIPVLW